MFRLIFLFLVILSANAGTFPLTIEHKFGTTIIEKEPKRVASLDWSGADNLLAVGVQPVTVRSWLCPKMPFSICSWAQPFLKSEPVVLDILNLDFEAIAATKPDLIIAIRAGISQEDYKKLSEIAPVVTSPKADKSLKWDERALIAARSVGKEKEMQNLIDEVNLKLDAAAKNEWKNKSVAIGFLTNTTFGTSGYESTTMQIMNRLGFVLPNSLIEQASEVDFLPLSEEEISRLDADLLIWINTGKSNNPSRLAGYEFLKAHQEGREILLEKEVNDPLRQASVLSIPHALDKLVPQIEKVLK